MPAPKNYHNQDPFMTNPAYTREALRIEHAAFEKAERATGKAWHDIPTLTDWVLLRLQTAEDSLAKLKENACSVPIPAATRLTGACKFCGYLLDDHLLDQDGTWFCPPPTAAKAKP